MESTPQLQPVKPYEKAFLGGTFDRFHLGHQKLISTACYLADFVFVGLVSDQLGTRLFPSKERFELIQSYITRYNSVDDYISTQCSRYQIGMLDDPWGPAPLDQTKQGVLVTSRETMNAGSKINSIRGKNKLVALDVVIIPWVKDNDQKIISSTRLRKEE
ncbi:MAG: pantetheine-phosphate adenylyltransferase [Candidatus Heimdallarchaeota archaeon]|nr:pantetheine-phosphate adenylyltransferase [Candidatus Heimdallarchaeota archaeon]